MSMKALVALAVGGAFLASIGFADITQPGQQVEETTQPSSPGNWIFTTGSPFCDNFDSYVPGPVVPQTPDWEEWAGSVDVSGIVTTDQAFSPPHSLNIIGTPPGSTGLGDDTVHVFDPADGGGTWVFSIMTYVPTGMTGRGWIILLNQYRVAPLWSLQVGLEGATGLIVADFNGENLPLIYDRWVEFRAEIDLEAGGPNSIGNPLGEVDYFYDDVQFVFDKEWSDIGGTAGPGYARIEAIDLYGGDAGSPGGPTTGVYFDDVQIYEMGQNPPCGGDCEPCDMNCDDIVDAFDIEPFLDLLFGPNPDPCNSCTGDVNGDGVIDAFDIEPFLECLFP